MSELADVPKSVAGLLPLIRQAEQTRDPIWRAAVTKAIVTKLEKFIDAVAEGRPLADEERN